MVIKESLNRALGKMEYGLNFPYKTIFTSFMFYKSCTLYHLSVLHFICKYPTDEVIYITIMISPSLDFQKGNEKKKKAFEKYHIAGLYILWSLKF